MAARNAGKDLTKVVTASASKENAKAMTFGGRSTVRAADKNRRPVFKPTLDAPYNISWPSIDEAQQPVLLKEFCHVLSCVAEYQTKYKRYVKRESRPFNPEKSRAHRRRLAKKKKSTSQTDVADQVTAMEVDMPATSKPNTLDKSPRKPITIPDTLAAERPEMLDALSIGLSSVTRILEREARRRAAHTITINNNDSEATKEAQPLDTRRTFVTPAADRPFRLVLVCRADMVPIHMYAHLPLLAYRAGRVPLVILPEGSEPKLARALGVRRAAVVGIKPNATGDLAALCDKAEACVRIPAMPWLDIRPTNTMLPFQSNLHIPTRIKTLKTTMPIKQKTRSTK